jgi:hypothetical protein
MIEATGNGGKAVVMMCGKCNPYGKVGVDN